ncbi:MAG: hypothetical protein ABIP51_04575 [Bacteroidia bacterium]
MQLNNRQLNVIRWDIKRRGVTSVSLREDLFDHICCLVEKEMEQVPDFKLAYLKVIKQFGSLRVLQIKTDQEIDRSNWFELFIKMATYFYVFLYLITAIIFILIPTYLFFHDFNIWYSLVSLPIGILGFVIPFTRVDYKKFDIIPFKDGLSPVNIKI